MFKRWGQVFSQLDFFQWTETARFGDINFNGLRSVNYIESISQCFSNCSYQSATLEAGATHVAVGFVDLGSLLHSTYVITQQPSSNPLRWIGYESSAYCVAKTLVISEMFRSGSSPEAILQVSYSSAWSQATLAAFRTILTKILASIGSCSLTPEVGTLLQYWLVHDVPLERARSMWLVNNERSCSDIAGFKRKQDRMAYCSYILTGQLLSATVGSVTMFAIPKGYGDTALDLNFLQTIWFPTLAEEWLKQSDVISAGIAIILNRISSWQQLILRNELTISVHHKRVTTENPAVLSEIAALKPSSMSWSNVPDYMHPSEFFSMAKACSASEKSIHYLYSMNWVTTCMGATVLDYGIPARKTFLQEGEMLISHDYERIKLIEHLHTPPFTNSINIATYATAHSLARKWSEAFFHFARLSNQRQFTHSDTMVFSPFARNNSTLFLAFTFDEHHVNFKPTG
jgi:hypothetical protein